MSLKEQAAAVLLEFGKEIESVDEEKIRKIRSKIERNIDLGEAEISELKKVAISKDSKIQIFCPQAFCTQVYRANSSGRS